MNMWSIKKVVTKDEAIDQLRFGLRKSVAVRTEGAIERYWVDSAEVTERELIEMANSVVVAGMAIL